MNGKRNVMVGAGLLLALTSGLAHAGTTWTTTLTPQTVVGDYNGSASRESFYGAGLFLNMDYFERGGFALGYNRTHVEFIENDNIDQDSYYGSGHLNLTPDQIPGTIGLRLDGHYISNDDASGISDDVSVVAPVISYAPYHKQFSLDLGYAYSSYDAFYAHQLTPTFSTAFNQGNDWAQFRIYHIQFSEDINTDGKDKTFALEAKLTHWLDPSNILKLDNLKLGGLLGERAYGVDMDGASVYNLSDLQKGSLSVGAEWRIGDRTSLMLLGGQEWYENMATNDNYGSASVYLSLSNQW